ncbi:MAG: hypothetical protein ABL874_05025 [Sphingopyxis sp.]
MYLFTMWRHFYIIPLCFNALLGCATPQSNAPAEMTFRVTGEPCGISLNDTEVAVGDLKQALVSVPRQTTILLQGQPNVQYQCIGSLIYTLQYLGFKSVGFLSESAN